MPQKFVESTHSLEMCPNLHVILDVSPEMGCARKRARNSAKCGFEFECERNLNGLSVITYLSKGN
jgi:thymidylate kinase